MTDPYEHALGSPFDADHPDERVDECESCDRTGECGFCDEPIVWDDVSDPAGEFWDDARRTSVVAHAQCGLDAGLRLA